MNLLPKVLPRGGDKKAAFKQQLVRHEAVIGGKLFGPLPKGHNRQFFCLDERTWVWHEEWSDKAGRHVVTTRYDVRPTGIIKTQNNGPARPLSLAEHRNFVKTVDLYTQRVDAEYERMLQAA